MASRTPTLSSFARLNEPLPTWKRKLTFLHQNNKDDNSVKICFSQKSLIQLNESILAANSMLPALKMSPILFTTFSTTVSFAGSGAVHCWHLKKDDFQETHKPIFRCTFAQQHFCPNYCLLKLPNEKKILAKQKSFFALPINYWL